MEQLLTVEDAARILRVSKNTLYTWAYRRQIPSQKVGLSLRFKREDLEAWLKAQARTVSWEPKSSERAFRSQIAEAKGNFLTEEGTVVTRFFYKGPSRRLQFDYVGPARVFLRLVLVFSLVIILWKVLS